MDFSFTPEQEQLRREARSFLTERYPAERVAELAESEAGWDADSWRELAELGWLGVAVPEEIGGAGLGFVEEAVLHEELGRALYPGPFFSTVALAIPALPPELQAEAAAGETTWSAALSGSLVPDLAIVERVLVDRDGRLLAVPAEGETLETVDPTRRLGRLAPDTAGDELGPAETLARVRPRALTALALEAVGVAQRALELAVEHVRTRHQFGRPVGTYQAVSHALADTYSDTELARSLAYWAAWCVAEEDDQAPVAAAAAKSFAAEAAVAACERAIQVHGGIGFTWEHVLHRLYKRAQWIEAWQGFGAALRAEVAAALLDAGDAQTETRKERDGIPVRLT
jgi:alkylation response protein AidB-like acyl-CoA dehydrogenase